MLLRKYYGLRAEECKIMKDICVIYFLFDIIIIETFAQILFLLVKN